MLALRKVKIFLDKLWTATSGIAGVLLLINMMVIMVNIIGRKFLNMPIYGSTEIVRYISLAAASLALAQNEWFDGNVKMTLLLEKIGKKAAATLQMCADFVATIALAFVTYYLWQLVLARYAAGNTSMDLYLPLWIMCTALAVGYTLLLVSFAGKSALEAAKLGGLAVSLPEKPLEAGMEEFTDVPVID